MGMVLLHMVAGLAIWAGASFTGAHLDIGDALAGALNSAPVAWLAIGASALALGWLPSAIGAVGALPVVGGLLLNVVTQDSSAFGWRANVSPFAHLGAVPNALPDWAAAGAFVAVGALSVALGVVGYTRRDLTT